MLETFFILGGEYYIYVLFLIGILTGFVGAMGGPSGFIITPFMILSGFPPVTAIATARFAAILPWFLAIATYKKANLIRTPHVYWLIGFGLIGGIIGTSLILNINEDIIYTIISIFLILIAPSMFLKKDFGLVLREYSTKRRYLGYFLHFLVFIYGGFIGLGALIFSQIVIVGFLGFTMLEAHANNLLAWTIMIIVSCAIFAFNGQIDYTHAFIAFAGMTIGSFFGARLIVKKGSKWIKFIVCGFAIATGLKILSEYI